MNQGIPGLKSITILKTGVAEDGITEDGIIPILPEALIQVAAVAVIPLPGIAAVEEEEADHVN